jgi:hypothetical protein
VNTKKISQHRRNWNREKVANTHLSLASTSPSPTIGIVGPERIANLQTEVLSETVTVYHKEGYLKGMHPDINFS